MLPVTRFIYIRFVYSAMEMESKQIKRVDDWFDDEKDCIYGRSKCKLCQAILEGDYDHSIGGLMERHLRQIHPEIKIEWDIRKTTGYKQ